MNRTRSYGLRSEGLIPSRGSLVKEIYMKGIIFLLALIMIFTLVIAVTVSVYLDSILKVTEKILEELKYMKD